MDYKRLLYKHFKTNIAKTVEYETIPQPLNIPVQIRQKYDQDKISLCGLLFLQISAENPTASS